MYNVRDYSDLIEGGKKEKEEEEEKKDGVK